MEESYLYLSGDVVFDENVAGSNGGEATYTFIRKSRQYRHNPHNHHQQEQQLQSNKKTTTTTVAATTKAQKKFKTYEEQM